MAQKMNSRLQIFTIILGLDVFLSCGGLVPAWGEGTVAFNADKNEEFSTPPKVHLVLQGHHHHYSHDTMTVTVIDKDGKEIERFQITNLNN